MSEPYLFEQVIVDKSDCDRVSGICWLVCPVVSKKSKVLIRDDSDRLSWVKAKRCVFVSSPWNAEP